MSRPRHADPPRDLTLSLPESLHETIRLHLSDPLTGRLKKGELSRLVTRLLREHFAGTNSQPKEPS